MTFSIRGLSAFIVLALLTVPSVAQAQTTAAQIGVVDVQKLLTQSKPAESIAEQLKDQRKELQADITAEEKKLFKLEEQYQALVEKSSEEELLEKRKEFQEKINAARQKIGKKKVALEGAALKSVETLRGEIIKIVAEIASEKGLDIVVTKQNVIMAKKEMDFTEVALETLNKRVKKISIDPVK